MASSAIAAPNGIAVAPMHATGGSVQAIPSNVDSMDPSTTGVPKRKRDEDSIMSFDQQAQADGTEQKTIAALNIGSVALQNYFAVLQKYDTSPSILKRPVPEPSASSESQNKRQKSEDGDQNLSIAEKVARGAYTDTETIISDIKAAIQDQLFDLQSRDTNSDNEKAIAATISFGQQVYYLFRREMAYPAGGAVPESLKGLAELNTLQSNASGKVMLTVYGEAPRHRPLYSSLQQPINVATKGIEVQPIREKGLPIGIKTTKAIPYSFPSPADKERKPKTLGELFPPPRNLQSLQPPKAPKSSTKGVHVGWHRPELTEKSKYRTGSYFSQNISTGRWLDYSAAAPPSQIMTKQRERAMSLAGNKPSITELEASEMESLFRGAFSSFAPSKDDSAAMVSSGLISQTMWWYKHGRRNFDRLIEIETDEGVEVNAEKEATEQPMDVDEDAIQKAIDDWDESMVDPTLEQACNPGKKSQEEKDIDELLQDVSDMIQTLVSYQKNRNLTLPSPAAQSRYAADPAHSDMLTNGSPVQPDDEERATYDTLKAQLSLIIQTLPPYAVARLNSDKLDELNISTKIEVKIDEYRGSMDEDETAVRARMASQAATQPARPPSQRAPSSYGQQFQANRAPMANTQQYYGAQTPVRAPTQRPPGVNYNQRPPGYKQPNQYTKYNAQLQQQNAAAYAAAGYGTPAQRGAHLQQQQQGGFSNMSTPNNQSRYAGHAPNTQTPNMQHQNFQQQQYPLGTPAHAQYNQYNGTPTQQRTASPHISQQHMAQHAYRPQPTPPRQPSFSGQPQNMVNPQSRGYPPHGGQMMQQQPLPQGQQVHPQQHHNGKPGTSQFQASLNSTQVEQAMAQNRARYDSQGARSSVSSQGQGQGVAAMPDMGASNISVPAQQQFGVASPSPQPGQMAGSPAMNGGQAQVHAPNGIQQQQQAAVGKSV